MAKTQRQIEAERRAGLAEIAPGVMGTPNTAGQFYEDVKRNSYPSEIARNTGRFLGFGRDAVVNPVKQEFGRMGEAFREGMGGAPATVAPSAQTTGAIPGAGAQPIVPGLPGSTMSYRSGLDAGLVPTIGPRDPNRSSPAYFIGDSGQVPQAHGAYINGQPVRLRDDSEVGPIRTGQINQDFINGVAPSFMGNRNGFQSPEAARIAAAGPRKITGATTIEGRAREEAQMRAERAGAVEGAATRQSAERIAQITARAQEVGAAAKAEIAANGDRAAAASNMAKAFQSQDGLTPFDSEGFAQALAVAGIIPQQGAAQGGPQDLNGDGTISADEAEMAQADTILNAVKAGKPVPDKYRAWAEAKKRAFNEGVKIMAGQMTGASTGG